MNNEGALIAFTLLSRMIVGSSILYSFFYFSRRNVILQLSSGFNVKTPELLLLSGLVIATIVSFFHLGNPIRAGNALNNLKTSWISREILSLFIFSLSLLLLFLGRWLMNANERILSLLFLFSAFSGAVLIIFMIRLYMIPTVITWATWYTPLSFIVTTSILGICGVLAYILAGNIEIDKSRSLLQILILFLVAEALITGLNQHMLSHITHSHDNHFLLDGIHLNFTIVRIAVIASVVIFLVFISRKALNHGNQSLMKVLIGSAIILVLLEEVAGKFLFYASYVRVGL